MIRIDHVGYAARSLERVEAALRERYGLGVERFPDGAGGHIPLSDLQYLEIHTPLHQSSLGRWIELLTAGGDRWWAWSVEVDDFDAIVDSRGLVPQTFAAEEGTAFTPWSGRHAGAERLAPSNGFLPYFITYDQTVGERAALMRRKHVTAAHEREVGPIAELALGGDRGELGSWLGGEIAEVTVDHGGPGISGVSIVLDGVPTPVRLD